MASIGKPLGFIIVIKDSNNNVDIQYFDTPVRYAKAHENKIDIEFEVKFDEMNNYLKSLDDIAEISIKMLGNDEVTTFRPKEGYIWKKFLK